MRSAFVEALETHVAHGADEVWVQLGSAQLHGPDGWTEVESAPLEVDLRTLRSGNGATFRIVDAPPGAYDAIRLDVSDAWAMSGNEKVAIASSFAGWSWIDIDVDLDVPECGPITIVITISLEWKNGWPYIHVVIDLIGGECDAGVPDAGVPDAAEPDAAEPDAAPVEEGDDVADVAIFRLETDDTELYALDGNVLAYGTGDGTVVAPDGTVVDAAFADPGHRVAIWNRAADPDVIFGAEEALIALQATGEQLWSWLFTCCNDDRLPSAVDPATGQVYFATNQRVFQRDGDTGTGRGASASHGDYTGYVALAPGLIWKAGTTGRITLYDRDADLVGSRARFSMIVDSTPLRAPAIASDTTAIISAGGDAYTGGSEPGMLSRVTLDREVAWEIDAGAITAPLIGAGDVIFVGTEVGGAYHVEAYSLAGVSLWSAPLEAAPTDMVVADDGLVYVAAGTEVVGLDQSTGERQQRFYGLTGAHRLLLDGGVLYVSDTGALYALPVAATGLDAAAPWPARFHDNQRTSSL